MAKKGKAARPRAGRSSTVKKAPVKKADNKSGITPLGDRVLIKPMAADETKTPSGIILPDTAQGEKTDRGTVVAVGEGKRDESGKAIPMQVKKGDKVLFQWGEKVEFDDVEYYIVGEANILAILTK